MSTRLPKQDSYMVHDLYGIAKRCDVFIHDQQVLYSNTPPKTIFISAYKGFNSIPFFIDTVLPTIVNPIVVVIASEDYTFPYGTGDLRENFYAIHREKIRNMIDNPIIERLYVENLDALHPKLTPIPLGIHPVNNPNYVKMYQDILTHPVLPTKERPIDILCNYRIHMHPPQWADRIRVKQYCQNEWKSFVTWKETLSVLEHRDLLTKSKFVLCVHGGGLDPSPRAWEAIIAGCIPIMEKSTISDAYARFPVIWVDKWDIDTITQKKLETWKKEFSDTYIDRESIKCMLSVDYWWNIITA